MILDGFTSDIGSLILGLALNGFVYFILTRIGIKIIYYLVLLSILIFIIRGGMSVADETLAIDTYLINVGVNLYYGYYYAMLVR